MAVRTRTAFKATKNSRYTANTTGDISSGDGADTFEDVADSMVMWEDDVLDEDDMASDSDTHVPTQQSVKAYVDAQVAAVGLSGTYTPTLTNGTNVASSNAPNPCYYTRVGDVVTVSGWIEVDVTASGNTSLSVSLPIPSNFTATHQLNGFGLTSTRENISIIADQTNDVAFLGFSTATLTNQVLQFTFQYLVL